MGSAITLIITVYLISDLFIALSLIDNAEKTPEEVKPEREALTRGVVDILRVF